MKPGLKFWLLMAAAALLLSGCWGWAHHGGDWGPHEPGHGYRDGYHRNSQQPCADPSSERNGTNRPPCQQDSD